MGLEGRSSVAESGAGVTTVSPSATMLSGGISGTQDLDQRWFLGLLVLSVLFVLLWPVV
jgi:hypothetical protein